VGPPTAQALTEEERRELAAAFAALPSLHRPILRGRLRGVSFLDGMLNTALTSTVNPDEPPPPRPRKSARRLIAKLAKTTSTTQTLPITLARRASV
jgi:hypothetical protein